MAALLETVRAHLRKLEVPARDIDDLTQEVMLAAWEKVCEGEFRIHPGVNARWATEGWLFGIAWRRVSHYRDRAHRRREVLMPEPLREARPRSMEPLGVLEARSALQCLARLKETGVEVLLTDAEDLQALASKHNVCMRAISARRTVARRTFLALVEHLHEAPELEDPSPGAVELLQQAEVQQLVFDCIQTLPAEMREVIIAYDVDGLSMEEIAERREVSLSTAYRLHTQGRQAFKAILLARVCVEEENAKKRRR